MLTSTAAADELSLRVSPLSACVVPGDPVAVTLHAANLAAPINSVQVLLQYEPTLLALDSITPNADVGVGWTEGFESDEGGRVSYIVTMQGGSISTDHLVATLRFTAVAGGTSGVVFRENQPPLLTRLVRAEDNGVVLPDTVDSIPITIASDTAACGIATASGWGLVILALLLVCAASVRIRHRGICV
ncbi:MAG: cohesin domain-containing protein [Phycisphaerae bacterium]